MTPVFFRVILSMGWFLSINCISPPRILTNEGKWYNVKVKLDETEIKWVPLQSKSNIGESKYV